MKPLSILICSSYYWPEASGNAPYVTGLAEHLSRRGHRVVVCTGFAHYPEWKSSAGRRLMAHEARAGVEIRRRRHYVPRKQSARQRALYESSLLLSGLTALKLRKPPDVILGISPTLSAAALAVLAAKASRRPAGLVFQDIIGLAAEQSGVKGGREVAATVQRIELGLARRATAVAVVSDGFRGYLEDGGVDPATILRVRNWTLAPPPSGPREEVRARLGWQEPEFVCLYAGSMGHKHGLENVLHAAHALRGSNDVRVVLAGDGSDRSRLGAVARSLALQNVDFHPVQAPGDYEAMLTAADVLLVNQRPSVADMSLASKLTSYLAAGRPVVAAVAPRSETAREIEASGGGVLVPVDEPGALASAIVSLRANPTRALELATCGQHYAREHLSAESALTGYERFLGSLARSGRSRRSQRGLRRW